MLYAINCNGSRRVANQITVSTQATIPFQSMTVVMKLSILTEIKLSNGRNEYGTNWRSDNAICTEKPKWQ
jgi:hypothetical protein